MDEDLEEIVMVNHILDQLQEAEIENEREPRRRHIFADAFLLSNEQFVKNFRLTKDLTRHVIELVTPFIAAPTRQGAITNQTKVFSHKKSFLLVC